jgi:peroxiredoxin
VVKIIAGVVVAIFAVLAIVNGIKHRSPPAPAKLSAPESDPEEIAKRTTVQDFILTDASGQTKKLSDFRGNVVILSFWASWCAPCLEELPTFAQLTKRFNDRGLRVIPVNVEEGDDGKNFAKKFWTAQHFDTNQVPSFFDTSKALASQFQVEMLPANFVIDREGRLAFSSFGANDWTNAETVEFLESLLQEN